MPSTPDVRLPSAAARAASLIARVVGGGTELEDRIPRGNADTAARWAAKTRQLRAAYPAEPWKWDHPWNERGAMDGETRRHAVVWVVWGLGLGICFLPWVVGGLVMLRTAESVRVLMLFPVLAIALSFSLIAARFLGNGAHLTARLLKYGRGVARFETFPFRRGGTLRLFATLPRTVPQHAVVAATLRCVQERYVTISTAEDSTWLRSFEVYRDTAAAHLTEAGMAGRALCVTFQIPRDAPSTDLASHPCRYWEVEVEAVTDGVSYGARFLVPVY